MDLRVKHGRGRLIDRLLNRVHRSIDGHYWTVLGGTRQERARARRKITHTYCN